MSPTVLEFVGLLVLTLGVAALVAAAWLIGGLSSALIVAGMALSFGGIAAVRAAAQAEKELIP